jgi:hypothetical protein
MCGIGTRRARMEGTRRRNRCLLSATVLALHPMDEKIVMCILRMLYDKRGMVLCCQTPSVRDWLQSRNGIFGTCGIFLSVHEWTEQFRRINIALVIDRRLSFPPFGRHYAIVISCLNSQTSGRSVSTQTQQFGWARLAVAHRSELSAPAL